MTSKISSKVPPWSPEAEQAVLGGILINNDTLDIVAEILSPECFYREAHIHLFAAMIALNKKRSVIDLVTLSEYLRSKNLLENAGGQDYISSLVDAVSTSAGIKHHAEIIKDLAIRRNILIDCSALAEDCLQPYSETSDLLSKLDHISLNHNNAQIKKDFIPMSEVVRSAFKRLETVSEHDGYITGLSTGFQDLDRLTAGLQPTDLIILAARPSAGKTSLAINIGENVAKQGKVVAVFSIEMSSDQLGIRSMGSDARIDSIKLRSGKLRDNDWGKLIASAQALEKLPIFIDESSGITCQDMKFKCKKLKKNHGLDLIIIDYLQLIRINGRSESKNIEVGEITRDLKQIAKDFKVPVLCLSQLSRKCEERSDKHPQLSDLRDSGNIEQDADIVMFIYRDEVYNPNNANNKNIAEIQLAKHRNGPIGFFKLTFLKEITKFEDYSGSDEEYKPWYRKENGFDE